MNKRSESKSISEPVDIRFGRFAKSTVKRCVKRGCQHTARHGVLCQEHALCEWEGCDCLKLTFSVRSRWCREHGEQSERNRRRKWNAKMGPVYKSKGKPAKVTNDLPHSLSVALILGRDPFR